MLCKHCGCDNLEGTTICVFCGEAIDKSDGGISQIMTAFAGEAVSEAEEMTEEGGDIQLVSALHRLRKTDVGSSETLSEGESRVALDEARVLMQGASPALMSELAAEEAEAMTAGATEIIMMDTVNNPAWEQTMNMTLTMTRFQQSDTVHILIRPPRLTTDRITTT